MPLRFTPLRVEGAFLVEMDPHRDERGFFARAWCRREFEAQGLDIDIAQTSVSWNERKGTLRGMHFQRAPDDEVKLVRCTRGAIWDVVVDVRPASPSFGRWDAAELTADNCRQLYIPRGVAHGFQTLEDATEVHYQISTFYAPESAAGFCYDDPRVGIEWPRAITVISAKDRALPSFEEVMRGT